MISKDAIINSNSETAPIPSPSGSWWRVGDMIFVSETDAVVWAVDHGQRTRAEISLTKDGLGAILEENYQLGQISVGILWVVPRKAVIAREAVLSEYDWNLRKAILQEGQYSVHAQAYYGYKICKENGQRVSGIRGISPCPSVTRRDALEYWYLHENVMGGLHIELGQIVPGGWGHWGLEGYKVPYDKGCEIVWPEIIRPEHDGIFEAGSE